ncbi:MAG: type VI secretion system Vgr family protein, partial [Methylococcaceae bacterium]|nr:type VI secretion system Vgr family protein [Methylococcaceae bacterium]
MPLNADPWTQQDRLIRLSTPLGADKLLAERLHGIENLSDGFRFHITALSEDAHIELKTLIGQPALLELMTSQSRSELRPFHGHITRIEMQGSNAGLARYRLTLEPWTAFLAYNRDSAIYQDMTVFDILDSLFQSYQGQGKLNPQWRYELADRSVYPKRSLTTQY